jgi:hypothetical protein
LVFWDRVFYWTQTYLDFAMYPRLASNLWSSASALDCWDYMCVLLLLAQKVCLNFMFTQRYESPLQVLTAISIAQQGLYYDIIWTDIFKVDMFSRKHLRLWINKQINEAGSQWLMPVIPATRRQRSGRLQFKASPGK